MMRRPLRVLLVVALVLLAAGAFTASALADDDDDDGGSPPQLVDFAEGEGTATFTADMPPTVSTFDFYVQSAGGVVTGGGRFTTNFGVGGTFTGNATCLAVSGPQAVFEIANKGSGGDIVVFVGDFGPAGAGDVYNFHPLPEGADAACPSPGATDRPSIVGDIVVGDNVPAPSGGDDDEDEEDDEAEDD